MQSNNGNARARYYWHDLKALIDGRGNHPSIYQWNTFNEQDMMHDFNTSNVVRWCALTFARVLIAVADMICLRERQGTTLRQHEACRYRFWRA